MRVLLSIKPNFAEKILSGRKKYEYRKQVFKKQVQSVLLYATLPIGKIIGEFYIDRILEDIPENLWNSTKTFSGISKLEYDSYFNGKGNAYAIKILRAKRFPSPIDPSVFIDNFRPPQSFIYIE